jgi:hypothetical protein
MGGLVLLAYMVLRSAHMHSRIGRGFLVMFVSAMITGTATASPFKFTDPAIGNSGKVLTAEQLEILDALSDNGWHLGWFKDKKSDFPSAELLPDSGLGTIGLPGGGDVAGTMFPGVGQVTQPLDATGLDVSAQLTTAPEPGTLLLFGGGLAAIAAKLRKRKAP